MTLIIEEIQISKIITRRTTPFYNVYAVHATDNGAIKHLQKIQKEYSLIGINPIVYERSFTIENIPWRSFTTITYRLEEAKLYGTNLSNLVYNLIRFNGYIKDQDKPYRYDNLGWFSSIEFAKSTKEWQILKYICSTRSDIDYLESELELKILGPYECTDMNPNLVIKPFTLLK